MIKKRTRKKKNAQGCPSIFGRVFDEKTLNDMAKHARPLLEYLAKNKPFTPKDLDKRISQSEIDRVVVSTMKRLPVYLRKAKRRLPTKPEAEDIRLTITKFLEEQFNAPSFDSQRILGTTEFAGIRAHTLENNFFASINGRIDLALFDVNADTEEGHEKSDAAKIALVIDFVLELIGLILGIIGIQTPKIDPASLEKSFARLVKDPAFQDAFKKLLEALKQKDWKAILKFLEYLEGSGNLGELLAHIFAELHWYDYAITIAKIIAWIIAAAATGGTALAAKIVALGLDIAGILIKVPELDKL